MVALKASVEINGGIIIGQPMEEYHKRLIYTSDLYHDDLVMIDKKQKGKTHFETIQTEALEFAKSIMHPNLANWVTLNWIWY